MNFFLYSVGGIGDQPGVACELRGSKSIRAGKSPHLTGYDVTKVKPKPGGNHDTQQNSAASVGAKQGLLHRGFPVSKPSSGSVGVPQHRARTPRTAPLPPPPAPAVNL